MGHSSRQNDSSHPSEFKLMNLQCICSYPAWHSYVTWRVIGLTRITAYFDWCRKDWLSYFLPSFLRSFPSDYPMIYGYISSCFNWCHIKVRSLEGWTYIAQLAQDDSIQLLWILDEQYMLKPLTDPFVLKKTSEMFGSVSQQSLCILWPVCLCPIHVGGWARGASLMYSVVEVWGICLENFLWALVDELGPAEKVFALENKADPLPTGTRVTVHHKQRETERERQREIGSERGRERGI